MNIDNVNNSINTSINNIMSNRKLVDINLLILFFFFFFFILLAVKFLEIFPKHKEYILNSEPFALN